MKIRRYGAPTPTPDLIAAPRRERAEVLRFRAELSSDEWLADSAAEGWRVQDILAHIGSACHAMFGAALMTVMTSSDIEATNDAFVERRHSWHSERILSEHRRWSARVITEARFVCPTPLRHIPIPLAQLVRSPMQLLLGGAMVFDWHTHLRHDIARGLRKPPTPSDDNRVAVVLAWMFAVRENQPKSSPLERLDQPLGIVRDWPGGGTWILDPNQDSARDGATFTDVET